MQAQVLRTQAVRFGSGVLKIDGVDFGALDNAELTVDMLMVEIKVQNAKLPPRKKPQKIAFKAELVEIYLPNIQQIDSHGILETTVASPVSVTSEAHGTGWTVGKPIKANHKNADNTIATSIVVKSGASTLAAGTDYSTYVSDGTNGETGYTYIVPLTPQSGAITFGYTYAPAAKHKVTWSDIVKLVDFYEVKFVNKDENGKEFTITIPKAYNAANMDFKFNSDDEVGEVMRVPLELIAFPDATNRLLVIEDEQAVA